MQLSLISLQTTSRLYQLFTLTKKKGIKNASQRSTELERNRLLRRRSRRRIVRNTRQRSLKVVQSVRHVVHYPTASILVCCRAQLVKCPWYRGNSHFPNISLDTLSNLCCSWSRSSSTAALNWPCASVFCIYKRSQLAIPSLVRCVTNLLRLDRFARRRGDGFSGLSVFSHGADTPVRNRIPR